MSVKDFESVNHFGKPFCGKPATRGWPFSSQSYAPVCYTAVVLRTSTKLGGKILR